MKHARALSPSTPTEPSVKNVIVLVLESLRWDYLADPELAPHFHRQRHEGIYFPRAIANYPATPLAYGAIFTSQPPSVLLAAGDWTRQRPFDCLRARFDLLVLSRPNEVWFENSTITDFFVPKDVPIAVHDSSREALQHVKAAIESREGRSFFAWAHLYEPHYPYETHPGYAFGDDLVGRYRSEVAYLDAELGRFLAWFHTRPEKRETLLIMVADHGEGLGDPSGDHPIFSHSFHVRNALTAVPLYAQAPGLPRDVVETELSVSQLDIIPTIFQLMGEQLPSRFHAQGRSLLELLRDRRPRAIASEQFHLSLQVFYDLVRDTTALNQQARLARFENLLDDALFASKIALWHGSTKLIYDRVLRRYWLYETAADPGEKHDLAASHPERLLHMQRRLSEWLRQQSWVIQELAAKERPG